VIALSQPVPSDAELAAIASEEETCLARVLDHLDGRREPAPAERSTIDYDEELLSLRDQMSSARTEDLPPLIEQMGRLQALASRTTESDENSVDPRSPYFGRLVLLEHGRTREVLIGRGTYLDTRAGIRIVDWRDAPISRLYYRYGEGDDYDEVFGEREVYGEVVTRRSLTISDRALRRISCPQGNFAKNAKAGWLRLDQSAVRLSGGEGTATRAERPSGKLGVGEAITGNEDKHLKEITPLIDARQFELITQPSSGLVVIQGGAGSGKTTIGLHRLAYLAYHDPSRFRPDKMLVVVFNEALARYISQVLPALGLAGVTIRTYQDWAARLRATGLPEMPRTYAEDTPTIVARIKKHPAMLEVIESLIAEQAEQALAELKPLTRQDPNLEPGLETFARSGDRPLLHRFHGLRRWIDDHAEAIAVEVRNAAGRMIGKHLERLSDVAFLWADLLTDQGRLRAAFARATHDPVSPGELERASAYLSKRTSQVVNEIERKREEREEREEREQSAGGATETPEKLPVRSPEAEDEPKILDLDLPSPSKAKDDGDGDSDLDGEDYGAVDGLEIEERASLDREDDALLLRLLQRVRGPLRRSQATRDPLSYEHMLIDEAQDLSPLEMAVLFDTVSRGQSITLAGDTAQRLHMDNGFSNWATVLGELGLSHVQVEPLELSYRSTAEILELSQHVLGPHKPKAPPKATRHGAPVELFQTAATGDSAGLLAEALRELSLDEPRASVAVIARYPEHADLYYEALRRGEVPHLRRIVDQEFPFKPGVDVTDVRQVKGLEFDYVILVEVTESSYPEEDDARHLLHIGMTRAAHQLWLFSSGKPSRLLPEGLRERGY
jgi:DNA helicase II / ATP-dependent DNA helicase PcrA